MPEEWRPIVGFEGLYSISSKGRVRRDAGGQGAVHGRILTPKKTRFGYRHIDLSRNDRKTRRLIHQLVAESFLQPRPSLRHCVNHKDANKANNNVFNLEWATPAENNAHARKLGLIPSCSGEKNGRSKLKSKDVAKIRKLKGIIGAKKISEMYGVSRSTIQWIHQEKHWTNP